MEDWPSVSPEVERLSGIWTPFSFRTTGLRKFGVPPGGCWNPSDEGILQALGEPLLLGEAAAPGSCSVVNLGSNSHCTWIVFGSPGWLKRDKEEQPIPALMTGIGSGELISRSGGRWVIAAYPSSAAPLLRGIDLLRPAALEDIRAIAAPEHQRLLEESEWVVSPQSSRIGLRLLGPGPDMGALAASRPSAPGVIQAPGKGEILIHGPAGPTSGGYPVLGAVIRADLHQLAQLPPGSKVKFQTVSREEALEVWQDSQRSAEKTTAALNKLKRLGLV